MISATNGNRDHTRTLENVSGRLMDVYKSHFLQNQTRESFRDNYTTTKVRYFSSYSVLFILSCPKYNAILVLL